MSDLLIHPRFFFFFFFYFELISLCLCFRNQSNSFNSTEHKQYHHHHHCRHHHKRHHHHNRSNHIFNYIYYNYQVNYHKEKWIPCQKSRSKYFTNPYNKYFIFDLFSFLQDELFSLVFVCYLFFFPLSKLVGHYLM